MNVPPTIGAALSYGLSPSELDRCSLEDLYDLLEVHTINRHNQAIYQKHASKE